MAGQHHGPAFGHAVIARRPRSRWARVPFRSGTRPVVTPTGINAVLFLVAIGAFFVAAVAGIAAFVTRLLDFRLTARKTKSGDTVAEPLTMFGAEASAFGRLTWFLFWILLIAMAIAVICSAIVLSCTYLGRIVDAICPK